MDYQTWLKAFGVELSHQWNGIAVDDLDSLHLQSLFHKGISPHDAAQLRPVLREVSSPHVPRKEPMQVQWLYLSCAIVMIIAFGLFWRVRRASLSDQEQVQVSQHRGLAVPSQGGYPSQTVNYGTYGNFEPFFTHSMPYHPKGAGGAGSRRTIDTNSSSSGDYSQPGFASGGPRSDEDQNNTLNLPAAGGRTIRPSGASTGGGVADQQTPVIQQFQVTSQDQNYQGFSGQISWQVTNADQVQVLVADTPISGVNMLQGTTPFSGLPLGTTITIRASRSGRTVEQSANVDSVQGSG